MTQPVPRVDATVERLDPRERDALARYWCQRATSERGARLGFIVIDETLRSVPSAPVVREMAARALEDERRHAQLCLDLARLYSRHAALAPDPPAFEPPTFDVEPELAGLLQVIAMCCVNESLAVVFLQRCLAAIESPRLRAIQRQHLADEVQHARLGWAHLAWVPERLRLRAGEWIAPIIDAQLDAWRQRVSTLPERGFPGHGLPPRETLDAELTAAVTTLLYPGFAALGVRP